MTLASVVRAAAPSPTLAAAVVFGLSGVGFVAANLVLARAMSPEDYAIVSLVVALVQIAMPLGPLGLDLLVARKRLDARPALLGRTLATALLTGGVAAALGAALYRMDARLVGLLLIGSLAGASNLVAAAVYQGRRRFAPALALSQSQNGFLLLGALVVLAGASASPWIPCAVYAAGYVAAATVGWGRPLRHRASAEAAPLPAGELVSLAGLTAVTIILIQAERLVVPRRLSLEDLALFGVLAAIAGSPFRVLQQGVGYTMLPRLRAAASVAERRRLLGREARLALVATVAASIVIATVGPAVVRWWLAGKYVLSESLILAALAAGFAKVASAFTTAAATALCTEQELARLRGLAWLGLVAGFAACVVGATWGLAGVVYGAGIGWFALALAAGALAAPHFREGQSA